MQTPDKIKVAIVCAGCLLFRLLPFRMPNLEPILASQMPLARQFGGFVGFLFGVLSILAFDLLTGTAGMWTLITAPTYGLLGALAPLYFNSRFVKGREGEKGCASGLRRHYVSFAIAGTLVYDAITGLTVGPLFFNQPLMAALIGQIPFTLMHLLGNVGFALTLSPVMEQWMMSRESIVPVSIKGSRHAYRYAADAARYY